MRDPWLLAALAVTVALRLALPLAHPTFQCFADECTYVGVARALSLDFGLPPPAGPERWLWAPLYPYLLYTTATLTGSVLNARWVQLALDLLAVVVLYRLTARIPGEARGTRAARIAAGLYAVHPTFVFFSGRLWSEAVYAPLLLFAVFATCWSRRGSWRRALLAGGLVGLCVLLRGVALYTLPLFVLAVMWPETPPGQGSGRSSDRSAGRSSDRNSGRNSGRTSGRSSGRGRDRWWGSFGRRRHAAALLLACAVVVAPYSVLASLRYEGFVVSDATLGRMMWLGNNEFLPMTFDWGNGYIADHPNPHAPDLRQRHRRTCTVVGYRTEMSPLVADRCEVRFGLQWIADHPGRFVARIPYRLAQLFNPNSFLTRHIRMGHYPQLPEGLATILCLAVVATSVLVVVAGTAGAFAFAAGSYGVLAVGSAIYQVAVVAALAGLTRYRIPIELLWLPFAAQALASPSVAWRRIRARPRVLAAWAAVTALLLALMARFAVAGFA